MRGKRRRNPGCNSNVCFLAADMTDVSANGIRCQTKSYFLQKSRWCSGGGAHGPTGNPGEGPMGSKWGPSGIPGWALGTHMIRLTDPWASGPGPQGDNTPKHWSCNILSLRESRALRTFIEETPSPPWGYHQSIRNIMRAAGVPSPSPGTWSFCVGGLGPPPLVLGGGPPSRRPYRHSQERKRYPRLVCLPVIEKSLTA